MFGLVEERACDKSYSSDSRDFWLVVCWLLNVWAGGR